MGGRSASYGRESQLGVEQTTGVRPTAPQNATEDDPQSAGETEVVRVRHHAAGRERAGTPAVDPGGTAAGKSSDVLGVRETRPQVLRRARYCNVPIIATCQLLQRAIYCNVPIIATCQLLQRGESQVRIPATLVPQGIFRALNAAGELPVLRDPGGTGPLGCREALADKEVPVVPGEVGATAVVAGGGGRVWNELAKCV